MEDEKNNNGDGGVIDYVVRLFGKKDPSKPTSANLKIMHGINKITIVVFLLAFIYWIAKRLL